MTGRARSDGGQESPKIQAEAAAFLARLHADDRSEQDEIAFRAWLAASEAHQACFDSLTQVWENVGALKADLLPQTLHQVTPLPKPITPVRQRRSLLKGLLGAGAVLGGGVGAGLLWSQMAAAKELKTGIGEQRRCMLPDGSELVLDAVTEVEIRYQPDLRCVRLKGGRVALHVGPDQKRPFRIEVGALRAELAQGRVTVQRQNERVQVSALSGQVRVSPQGQPLRVVTPGQRLSIAETSALAPPWQDPAPPRLDRPEAEVVTAWQEGREVFQNTPLLEAITDMNRYALRPIRLSDPGLEGLQISGIYRVGDNLAFAHAVSVLLGLKVEDQGQVIVLSRMA